MKKNEIHPAAIRSRNCITDSLLTLMDSMDYDKITIKEITEHAVLTRRTFYAHFKTKEEVLDQYFTALNNQLILLIKEETSYDQIALAKLYFNFWIGHQDLLSLIKKQQLLPLIFENFESSIYDLRALFGCNLSKYSKAYTIYSSAIFTGILSSILSTWIDNGYTEDADTLVEMLKIVIEKLNRNFSTA